MADEVARDSIRIPTGSRYKDTGLFVGDNGFEYGLMEPPSEPDTAATRDQFHKVASIDIGSLDSIAVLYYGRGYEFLWWFLALANRIIDPERDMYIGQSLRIPPRASALSFVNREGRV